MRARTGTPGSLSEGGQEMFEYPPELYDYSRTGYEDYHGYEYNGYRWDPDVSAWVETTTDVIPQRQTPEKFMIPHRRAAFGPNGQLVSVLLSRPADGEPATVEIHNVQAMLEVNLESQELAEFPGPLVRGDTHKNDVLLYCQSKARACAENMALEDRDSAELIWRFLELLIKQNGTVVGTDIADLLLQGHEPTTQDYRKTGMQITPSSDHLEADEAESDRDHSGRSLEECTDRFRHLLMYGRKKDALDWAMKNNLWGHALFLASKMDPRAHASVMLRFANVAMRMNDPLQTLYQLMSGRQPAAVTCVTEERWGDWRPHLAMILSNQTTKTELDRKSITTLGDTLGNAKIPLLGVFVGDRSNAPIGVCTRNLLIAGRTPYPLRHGDQSKEEGYWTNLEIRENLEKDSLFPTFPTYQGTMHDYSGQPLLLPDVARRLRHIVLIGSSHGLPLELFANNEAIQCTKIYEYALALGNVLMALISFQKNTYLYASRLADYGYAQEYCEVIARQINTIIFDLSSQLKFSDPRMEEEEDVQDPEWLRALHATLVQFEQPPPILESGEVGMYMQAGEHAIPQAREHAIPQGGEHAIPQGGEHTIPQGGEHTIPQCRARGACTCRGRSTSNSGGEHTIPQAGEHTISQGGMYMQAGTSNSWGTHHFTNRAGEHTISQCRAGLSWACTCRGRTGLSWACTSRGRSTSNSWGTHHFTDRGGEHTISQGGEHTISQSRAYGGMYMKGGEHTNPQAGLMGALAGGRAHEATYVGNTMYAHGAYEAQAYQTLKSIYPALRPLTGLPCRWSDRGDHWIRDARGRQPASKQIQWQEQPKLTGFPQDVNLGESQNSAITSQSNQSEKRSSIASNSSISQEEQEDTVDAQNPGNFYLHQPSIFDLQPAQTRIIAPKLRPRTISESSNGSGGGGRDRHPSGGRNLNQSKSKPDSYSGNESLPAAAAGGLFSRKNEMKLPDDKEPAVCEL
ncbi:hypothetical protein DPMN_070370 [Dreissena polymorpha]|uniref:Protein transport protein sec16 n=1 Tax=Dreissena polymorpha TaxID=45954 RepID=A0A9D3Z315_DREPO|nr:hypothetical protein DPMN_070370 [Dreissena polymorpha]